MQVALPFFRLCPGDNCCRLARRHLLSPLYRTLHSMSETLADTTRRSRSSASRSAHLFRRAAFAARVQGTSDESYYLSSVPNIVRRA
jgi:hypothetical protein